MKWVVCILLLFCLSLPAAAGDVEATWDPVTLDVEGGPETISHYILYYGQTSRPKGVTHPSDADFSYDDSVNVGIQTRRVISGLEDEVIYYFTVVAVDYGGNVSNYSTEVNSLGEETEYPIEGSCGCGGFDHPDSFLYLFMIAAWFFLRSDD